MNDQYAREYYDFLQGIRDLEDESAQRAKRDERVKQQKLRHIARVLAAFAKATAGLPTSDVEAVWKSTYGGLPEWKPVTDLVFPGPK